MTKDKAIKAELAALAERAAVLREEAAGLRAKKRFQCVCCPGTHRIMDCDLTQTHWYTKPRGCTGGDYWNEGEVMIACPATGAWNRVLWHTGAVPWDKRSHYEYSAEGQFKRLYKPLFKSVVDDHEKHHGNWINTYHFDENRAKYGLHVKGVDK